MSAAIVECCGACKVQAMMDAERDAAECNCSHAPEQHGPEGCNVVALVTGECPCRWNGTRKVTP